MAQRKHSSLLNSISPPLEPVWGRDAGQLSLSQLLDSFIHLCALQIAIFFISTASFETDKSQFESFQDAFSAESSVEKSSDMKNFAVYAFKKGKAGLSLECSACTAIMALLSLSTHDGHW